MSIPLFSSDSRLMLIAPHPDDEALACSVILHRAIRAGAAIRVLYATDGEDNPWPQRVLERKWRLNAADRRRWGKLRRAEALDALKILGVPSGDADFLCLPDQRLTHLLVTCCGLSLERLAASIHDWSPTHLLVPSVHDTHPDHNALGVMLRLVTDKLYRDEPLMSVWSYIVHGNSAAFFDGADKLHYSKAESELKEQAIRCHKTQLKLSRQRFLAYAARPESFLKLNSCNSVVADRPIRWLSRDPDTLRLNFMVTAKPMWRTRATLFVLGRHLNGAVHCLSAAVPVDSCVVKMFDCQTPERFQLAQYRGDAFAGEFVIPVDNFSSAHALFVKMQRRSWFFDEAGWLESPPVVAETLTPITTTRSIRSRVLS